MDDLIAFLNARLDEDEAAARAVQDNSDPWPGQWEADEHHRLRTFNGWTLAVPGTPGGEFKPGVLAHIARHDPARVLRDVEADRRLLAEWQKAEADPAVDDQWNAGLAAGLRLAVQIRAARHSGRPDYRQEWAPLAGRAAKNTGTPSRRAARTPRRDNDDG
jgi:hypothetical protein